ncbi:hypothetical protein MUB15_08270 [Priestia sp. OVS21]|nr:hypothetical protein [Priestia sp. OVS21]
MDIQKVEVTDDNQTIITSQDQKLVITPLPEAFNDEDELSLNIKCSESCIPLLLKNELPESMPITGQRIWKLIRETGKDIQWFKKIIVWF